jgi:signal transduction histidine kinase
LTIDSVEGGGSTFTCHFPRSRLMEPPAEYLRAKSSA